MAYRSHHCSTTLRYSVCINVFPTLLALFVLFPVMLYALCPFNAPFPFYRFLLLRSASFFTPQSHPKATTTTLISSFFNILIVSVLLVHPIPHASPCSLMSSTLPVHHGNSSASLAVRSICQLPLRTVFIPLVDS
jgi:hypothetical protein